MSDAPRSPGPHHGDKSFLTCAIGEELYKEGKYEEAAESFAQLANEGHHEALVWLGRCHYNGFGVTLDRRRAAALFKEAAEKKVPSGLSWLGYCYEKGNGVPSDKEEAIRYYKEYLKLEEDPALERALKKLEG